MKRKMRRLRSLTRVGRLERLDGVGVGAADSIGNGVGGSAGTRAASHGLKLNPPSPPLLLTPSVAADPDTDMEVLWHIARYVPDLRRWLVVNPKADAHLLEYISQAGGPGVHRALKVLLDSLDSLDTSRAS